MNKRNSITITLKGPAQLYYANMVDGVTARIKQSARDNADVMPIITDAHILRYIIADYIALKYGQEERQKIRNTFHTKYHGEMKQRQEDIKLKYA